jgi:hypothetical protein
VIVRLSFLRSFYWDNQAHEVEELSQIFTHASRGHQIGMLSKLNINTHHVTILPHHKSQSHRPGANRQALQTLTSQAVCTSWSRASCELVRSVSFMTHFPQSTSRQRHGDPSVIRHALARNWNRTTPRMVVRLGSGSLTQVKGLRVQRRAETEIVCEELG